MSTNKVGARLVALLVGAVVMVGSLPTSQAEFSESTSSSGSLTAADFYVPEVEVTTVQVFPGDFDGTDLIVSVGSALNENYFVIVRGAAGNASQTQLRQPAQNYARVAGDPFGNFGVVTAPGDLLIRRSSASSDWQGQISVVESHTDPAISGFRLRDVVEVTMNSRQTAKSSSSAGWSDIKQVGIYGGVRGGGVSTTATAALAHSTAWARIFPSGSSTVNFERRNTGGNSLKGSTTFTAYVVEWGAAWSIQRVTIDGSSGGPGSDPAHFLTAPIAPVPRRRTFVLAYGNTDGGGVVDGLEGHTT
ncbi:MAG: hypothetical protein ACR2NL_05695, partial [Acidimicrobiia bacterium]